MLKIIYILETTVVTNTKVYGKIRSHCVAENYTPIVQFKSNEARSSLLVHVAVSDDRDSNNCVTQSRSTVHWSIKRQDQIKGNKLYSEVLINRATMGRARFLLRSWFVFFRHVGDQNQATTRPTSRQNFQPRSI